MSSIPDWQQVLESEYFAWCCAIWHDLAKSPMHLEDQFLVHNGVYTDINNDHWVKCSKCLSPYHIKCLQENVHLHAQYVCSFMSCHQ